MQSPTISRNIGVGTFEAGDRAKAYVNAVLNSGLISYGLYSKQFESEFARLHGRKFAVLSNSGTSSLLVALQTLKELHGWQAGDEVIVPSITFVATVNVVLGNRLKPVLVDVEPDYYGIDVSRIEAALTPRTRCLLPVHPFGQVCDIAGVMSLARTRGLSVVEDSCETMLVGYEGQSAGAWGDIGCFSTYVAHLITTGVGGVGITDNPDYAKTMRSLVNHGMSYGDLSADGNHFEPKRTRRDFVFDRVGHSFRITELEAAIGLAQLETWRGIILGRQANAVALTERLRDYEQYLQLPMVRPGAAHAWMMYPLVCRVEGIRDRLMAHLEAAGIGSRRMLPLTCQPVYRGLFYEDDYPVARWINENGFYIGCHQGLGPGDLDYMAEVIGGFFNE